VMADGCKYRDSIEIRVKPLPVVNLGLDTTVCEGTSLQLQAYNPNSTYIWQDNSSSDKYTVDTEGTYRVEVNMNSCFSRDTINVEYKPKPRFTLGENQIICSGQPIILRPMVDPAWQLLWQDGTNNTFYTVNQPGIYSLEASNECGVTREEVLLTEGLCNVYIPNAFTPNADNRNELFKISGTALMNFFHLQIYNRYGKLVFETTDKNKAWDGIYKNKAAEAGAYIYMLKYKDNRSEKIKSLKGSFLLLR
jgi:gliding motility-associated-like protein